MITKSKYTPTPIFYRDADYHLKFSDQLARGIKDSNILHFSYWPLSMDPAKETIEKCIEVAEANHLLIGLDPNYHPKLWKNDENHIDYLEYIISKVDIVKPSMDDANRLFGKDTVDNHLKKILDLGAKLVVMTLGEDGAIASNGDETITFNSLATKIVDTTGAGDAFWSGFYAALIKGYTVKKALQFGFAVSAYKLKFTGAVVELPELENFKDMYF
ncbi:carbohydrate kinase family protein [Oceanobacillus alkalisoli]|uniref:carbohydrate kinase family protein n=1 Tax=Oceanobacillus alkalisoli TaxID=2925113 RepID=UPI0034E27145